MTNPALTLGVLFRAVSLSRCKEAGSPQASVTKIRSTQALPQPPEGLSGGCQKRQKIEIRRTGMPKEERALNINTELLAGVQQQYRRLVHAGIRAVLSTTQPPLGGKEPQPPDAQRARRQSCWIALKIIDSTSERLTESIQVAKRQGGGQFHPGGAEPPNASQPMADCVYRLIETPGPIYSSSGRIREKRHGLSARNNGERWSH